MCSMENTGFGALVLEVRQVSFLEGSRTGSAVGPLKPSVQLLGVCLPDSCPLFSKSSLTK